MDPDIWYQTLHCLLLVLVFCSFNFLNLSLLPEMSILLLNHKNSTNVDKVLKLFPRSACLSTGITRPGVRLTINFLGLHTLVCTNVRSTYILSYELELCPWTFSRASNNAMVHIFLLAFLRPTQLDRTRYQS